MGPRVHSCDAVRPALLLPRRRGPPRSARFGGGAELPGSACKGFVIMSSEKEFRHECVVFTKPTRASVGDTLDGYMLCTNSVFVMCLFSLMSTIYAMVWVKWTAIESLQLGIEVLTLVTACLSIKVAVSGSRPAATFCVVVMLLRLMLHLWICYIGLSGVRTLFLMGGWTIVVPNYPLESKIGFVVNALVSFVTLTYYALFFGTLQDADQAELEDGLKEARKIRANRRALGKGHYHWVADCMQMSEYDLYEDYVQPRLRNP